MTKKEVTVSEVITDFKKRLVEMHNELSPYHQAYLIIDPFSTEYGLENYEAVKRACIEMREMGSVEDEVRTHLSIRRVYVLKYNERMESEEPIDESVSHPTY